MTGIGTGVVSPSAEIAANPIWKALVGFFETRIPGTIIEKLPSFK